MTARRGKVRAGRKRLRSTCLAQHVAARVVWRKPGSLTPFPGNPRKHPEKQLAALGRSVARFGITNPILIDESRMILAGHARFEVANRQRFESVPTLTLAGLTASEKQALVIADNRVPEQALWDHELLREKFQALIDVEFDVELTGFGTGEVDLIIDGIAAEPHLDPDDTVTEQTLSGPAISKEGDVWDLGPHRIMCGDAREPTVYQALLGRNSAQMVFTDPPYNLRISSAVGRGRTKYREFVTASGELSSAAFTEFLTRAMRCASAASADGAIEFWCIDWRHLSELGAAAKACQLEQKNLVAWVKTNAGQGAFYRSQHELVAVFKKGIARHINNFGLGDKGRYRTNVWTYPSVNSLHPARRGDLPLHPTVKPVALVADAIRDCSKRNGIILDPFGGSGTTILAAERTGRIARLIELDPQYVDVAVRRWQVKYGCEAREVRTGMSFDELAERRSSEKGDRANGRAHRGEA